MHDVLILQKIGLSGLVSVPAQTLPAAAAAVASFAVRSEHVREEPASGFTLLEIIVALAVLGLLLVGLVQGSRFVFSGWETHNRLLERNADLDAVDRTLRHLIEHARLDSEWERLVFSGAAHSLTFTSIMPVSSGEFPTQRADVKLVVDAGHRLLLVWTPHLHAIRTGRPPKAQATEVLQGVDRVDLSYLSATQAGEWTREWNDAVPPRLVRIRIVFSDTSHAPWPDIVAAPMIDPP